MIVAILIVAAIAFIVVVCSTPAQSASPAHIAPVRRENNDFSMYEGIAENNKNVNQSGSYGMNGVFYANS